MSLTTCDGCKVPYDPDQTVAFRPDGFGDTFSLCRVCINSVGLTWLLRHRGIDLPCQKCGGRGTSHTPPGEKLARIQCPACGGSGDAKARWTWTPGSQTDAVVTLRAWIKSRLRWCDEEQTMDAAYERRTLQAVLRILDGVEP